MIPEITWLNVGRAVFWSLLVGFFFWQSCYLRFER